MKTLSIIIISLVLTACSFSNKELDGAGRSPCACTELENKANV